jgi:hypothetical protein
VAGAARRLPATLQSGLEQTLDRLPGARDARPGGRKGAGKP